MKQGKPIYLDYNATTPIDPEVARAMQPYLEQYFGNPSSIHPYGIGVRNAVENARRHIAALLNCEPDEVIFTSGGTEANNLAIKGVAFQHRNKGNHIITTNIEHPAVAEVCRFLEGEEFRVTYVPVDENGLVDPGLIEKYITAKTILISVMHANNEVGTIQPIEAIGAIALRHGILFHSDASQSVGKIATDVKRMSVDLLSLAGHKFYAPKGVGALFIRRGVKLQKLMHGANHEQNLRAGTENVLEIVGLGKAAEIAKRDLDKNIRQMQLSRDILYDRLKEALPEIRLNGHLEQCLPNTLSIGFPDIEANTLLYGLQGIAASAGAACHCDQEEISSVLTAMKVPPSYAMGTIRFSTGKDTTIEEAEQAVVQIIEIVKSMRSEDHKPDMQSSDHDSMALTHFTHGLGCGCKMRPLYLEKILKDLPQLADPKVLIDASNCDDAAVYLISEDTALVQTLDFFTPIVDDPFTFGAIAAANALSDIYAMGAKPLFALNIVGFPSSRLPLDVLKAILKGASEKAAEAGIPVLGGHTIEDTEPKFGMAITGQVHPKKVVTKTQGQVGDALVLTKPLGSGIISTAMKRGVADEQVREAAIKVMTALNVSAAEVMKKFPVNACTDISGFGLLGHLKEMAQASGVNASIFSNRIPLIAGTKELALAGFIPGGSRNNLEYVDPVTDWSDQIPEYLKLILCDAQTSGGLLIALPAVHASDFIEELDSKSPFESAVIGELSQNGEGKIRII